MLITSAAQTDIGLLRAENEDRLLCLDELGLYVVADGIGGLPGGAEAAETAVRAVLREARKCTEGGKPVDLAQAFQAAHQDVLDLAIHLAPDTGLGTTLCAAVIHDTQMLVANVGDCRCYLFRDGHISLLTLDDTVENDVLQRQAKGEAVRLEERYRHALTRCIGQPMPLQVLVFTHSIQAGDQVLICSDGISRAMDESVISGRLDSGRSPAQILTSLINESLAQGGSDNATGVLARIERI
ncbi:MAG: serine/threonine-protein phosphatase [Verrucomicrobia bacterium]|nr:MAG: serine/threonine-protein phosphatase [Verrucomicrobiota bacterium]